MVKDAKVLAQFERDDAARQSHDRSYAQALQLFESLWNEARALQSAGKSDGLTGLEADFEIARTLNALAHPGHV